MNYLRIASAKNGHEFWEIAEVHAAKQHGGCDVTVINPHTGRRNRITSWTSDIVESAG